MVTTTTPLLIRREWQDESQKWFFCIVDVLGIATTTANPRNYWKVQKSRLKKSHNELVTECIQLRMKAKDGKYYLTDTADFDTMIEIIRALPDGDEKPFLEIVKDLDTSPHVITNVKSKKQSIDRFSTEEEKEEVGESELLVDAYEKENFILIEALIAGVPPEDLKIIVDGKKVTLSGKRKIVEEEYRDENKKKYLFQELIWTTFSRTISLPFSVKKSSLEKFGEGGRITIRLEKA